MSEFHFTTLRGHTLASLEFNPHLKTTPIICIHGIGSSANFWRVGQTPDIAKHYRWISLALPGHYPAKMSDGFANSHLTPELIVDLLAKQIQELIGEQKAILLGHSTGGFAALGIAARHPQLVQGVISVSGFASGKWGFPLGPLQWLANQGKFGQRLMKFSFDKIRLTRTVYKYVIAGYAYDSKAFLVHPQLEETLDYLYPDAKILNLDYIVPYFNRMPHIDIISWMNKITVPTLIIQGDKDTIILPKEAKRLHEAIPYSELVWIQNSGHLPMAEKSDDYNKAVTDWLVKQKV